MLELARRRKIIFCPCSASHNFSNTIQLRASSIFVFQNVEYKGMMEMRTHFIRELSHKRYSSSKDQVVVNVFNFGENKEKNISRLKIYICIWSNGLMLRNILRKQKSHIQGSNQYSIGFWVTSSNYISLIKATRTHLRKIIGICENVSKYNVMQQTHCLQEKLRHFESSKVWPVIHIHCHTPSIIYYIQH